MTIISNILRLISFYLVHWWYCVYINANQSDTVWYRHSLQLQSLFSFQRFNAIKEWIFLLFWKCGQKISAVHANFGRVNEKDSFIKKHNWTSPFWLWLQNLKFRLICWFFINNNASLKTKQTLILQSLQENRKWFLYWKSISTLI